MKKILVVLLTLAVAGGVFAQGWSLSASGQIGTYINFDPMYFDGTEWQEVVSAKDEDYVKQALVNGTSRNRPYNGWDGIKGTLGMGYTAGPLNVGIDFKSSTMDGSEVMGTATINGENYTFVSAASLGAIFQGYYGDGPLVDRLWGQYNMLNGMVELEVAYKSRREEWWFSNKAALFTAFDGGGLSKTRFNGLFETGDSFSLRDGHSFLRTALKVGGLDVGLLIPNLFANDNLSGDTYGADLSLGRLRADGTTPTVDENTAATRFIEDSIKMSVIGVKFQMQPIEFAAQFRPSDYGIYFGGKFDLSVVSFGLSFEGILRDPDPDYDTRRMKFGASVNYDGGAFGAGLRGVFTSWTPDTNEASTFDRVLALEPSFFYNVIPTHLRFQLDAGFYFEDLFDGGDVEESYIYWAVQPQLFWNFNGTGASGDPGTGMLIRYRLVSSRVNALDVTFKWSL